MTNKKEEKKTIVKRIDRREFRYSRGDVVLSFSLRTDIPDELLDFRVCMQAAIKELDNMLGDNEQAESKETP